MYSIEVDKTVCIGYGLCARTAPNSLRLDPDGLAEPIAGTTDDESVVEAALTCPVEALSVRVFDELEAA